MASILASCNDTRGGDSWGYYAPDSRTLFKGLGRIDSSVGAKRLAECPSIMAHTRLATTGTVSTANAHPFTCRDVVLAHNGIVSNWRELNTRYSRNCNVDSEHLVRHVAKELPLKDVEAWGAVEYVDRTKPGAIFLCRFNGGSLSVATTEYGTVWSSDASHLAKALAELRPSEVASQYCKDSDLYSVANGVVDFERSLDVGYPTFSGFASRDDESSFKYYPRRYDCRTNWRGKRVIVPDSLGECDSDGIPYYWDGTQYVRADDLQRCDEWQPQGRQDRSRGGNAGGFTWDKCVACGMDEAAPDDDRGRCAVCRQFDDRMSG